MWWLLFPRSSFLLIKIDYGGVWGGEIETSQTASTLFIGNHHLAKKKNDARTKPRPTYRIDVGEVVEQHLSCTHFVSDSSYGPVLAADVDPLVTEQLLSLGTGVQKQVIGFAAVLILGHPETVQVAVGLAGGVWALSLRARVAALLRVCRGRQRSTPGCFILEYLRQHPTAVGRCYSEPHCFSSLFFLPFPLWFLHSYTSFSFFSHGSHPF